MFRMINVRFYAFSMHVALPYTRGEGDVARPGVDSRSDQGTYADILIGQSKEPLAKSTGSLANSGNAATMATK